MILKTENLSKNFGGLSAVNKINFTLEEGEIRGLIGPNGSGKSTFFNLLSGIYLPEEGSRIWISGTETTSFKPHQIASLGVARTFQLLRVFGEMTVLENLLVGHHLHVNYNSFSAAFSTRKKYDTEKFIRNEMMELLTFIGLADFAELYASELSVGQRRLLALGRAMAMRPKLLMLDEPAAGLSPVNVDNLLNIILSLKERYGLTIIVIEHILKVVMNTCERITVLDHGQKIAEGSPEEVKNDHAVIEAYLGQEMADEDVRHLIRG